MTIRANGTQRFVAHHTPAIGQGPGDVALTTGQLAMVVVEDEPRIPIVVELQLAGRTMTAQAIARLCGRELACVGVPMTVGAVRSLDQAQGALATGRPSRRRMASATVQPGMLALETEARPQPMVEQLERLEAEAVLGVAAGAPGTAPYDAGQVLRFKESPMGVFVACRAAAPAQVQALLHAPKAPPIRIRLFARPMA